MATAKSAGHVPAETASEIQITKLRVKNFRLLQDVELNLQETTTLLVGRNNSGKTTLVDLLFGFTKRKSANFTAADFSEAAYVEFKEAYQQWVAWEEEEEKKANYITEKTPAISLEIYFEYPANITKFGPLAPFILTLQEDSTTACLRYSWELDPKQAKRFYTAVDECLKSETQETGHNSETSIDKQVVTTATVMKALEKEFTSCFRQVISATDPDDTTNVREITSIEATKLLQIDFVAAQRGIDDDKVRPKEPLSNVYRELFDAAKKQPEGKEFSDVMENLQEVIDIAERNINQSAAAALEQLAPQFHDFGYPNLSDPDMVIQTRLSQDLLFSNNSSIHYHGHSGITRPENYSGLGSRNLIWILLSITSFQRRFIQRKDALGAHLIIIEEPEAHLHPQMQQAFVRSIERLPQRPPFAGSNKPWQPQFLISTHSSHIANAADFSSIRYFKVKQEEHQTGKEKRSFKTEIRDLSKLSGNEEDKRFLQQYLKLTESDLYFADKAIFIEGTAERLLIPAFIHLQNNPDSTGKNPFELLRRQYYTLIEVGGAFAYKFKNLLDFIEIPTLVITDIDSVKPNGSGKNVRRTVNEGETTSNSTLKNWLFPPKKNQATPSANAYPLSVLMQKTPESKAIKLYIRVAYQVPEPGEKICARTFEDAFILANRAHYSKKKDLEWLGSASSVDSDQNENESNEDETTADADPNKDFSERLLSYVSKLSSKSSFALDALDTLIQAHENPDHDQLKLPHYITEGLTWLAQCNEGTDPRNDGATGR